MEEQKVKEEQQRVVFDFTCSGCGISEKAHYKGTTPPFSRNIILKYPGYVMKDPFSPPGKGEILVLGADCAMCEQPICISKECSVFYTKMFCINCALSSIDKFPVEIKTKIWQQKQKVLST